MFTIDELKRSKLCCVLGETELTRFAEKAADVRLSPGEWLIREGEPPWFYVLFEGKLRVVKEILGRQQDLFEYEYEIGDFFGETPILLGTQYLVSLRAETHCRVARLERQEFRNLIRDSKEASAMILQTMNDRLMRAQKYATTVPSSRVLILGTKYDTDCRDIRAFLAANRIPFEFVDRNRSRSGCRRSCPRIGVVRRWRSMESSLITRPPYASWQKPCSYKRNRTVTVMIW